MRSIIEKPSLSGLHIGWFHNDGLLMFKMVIIYKSIFIVYYLCSMFIWSQQDCTGKCSNSLKSFGEVLDKIHYYSQINCKIIPGIQNLKETKRYFPFLWVYFIINDTINIQNPCFFQWKYPWELKFLLNWRIFLPSESYSLLHKPHCFLTYM